MDHAQEIDGWLARLLRARLLPTQPSGAELVPLPAGLDAVRVESRVSWHGLVHVLAPVWQAGVGLPEAVAARLRQEAMLRGFWEEAHRAAIGPLLTALHRQQIPALLMKGTALAYALYPQPASRVRGDTDLLVNERDLAVVRRVLSCAGGTLRPPVFGVMFQQTWAFPGAGGTTHHLDLHWQASDSPLLQRLFDMDAMFAEALPVPRFAEEAKMAPRPQALVQLALNAHWHTRFGYRIDGRLVKDDVRLVWLSDAHLLAGAMDAGDWRRLAALAVNGGVAPLVHGLLEQASLVLGTALPQGVMGELANAPRDTPAMRYLALTRQAARARADLAACRGLSAKARFAAAMLVPPGDFLRERYPRSAHWPRPLLLARHAAGSIVRAFGFRRG